MIILSQQSQMIKRGNHINYEKHETEVYCFGYHLNQREDVPTGEVYCTHSMEKKKMGGSDL